MAGQDAPAERIGHGQVAPIAAQIVAPCVVNAISVEQAFVSAGNSKQCVARIRVVGAESRPAEVEIVGRESPHAAGRLVFNSEELKQVPIEHWPEAEHAVVLQAN